MRKCASQRCAGELYGGGGEGIQGFRGYLCRRASCMVAAGKGASAACQAKVTSSTAQLSSASWKPTCGSEKRPKT